MKYVTYEIRGMVLETMIPAITASCESLCNVQIVRLSVSTTDSEDAVSRLTLTMLDSPTEEMEKDLERIMTAKGLELILASKTVSNVDGETPDTDISADASENSAEQTATTETADEAEIPPSPAVPPIEGVKHYVAAPPPKEGKTVKRSSAIATAITAFILAVLLTFALTTTYMKRNIPAGSSNGADQSVSDQLDIIDRLFRSQSIYKLDDEAMAATILKAYVAATGDRYAAYLTPEELTVTQDKHEGKMCGIGISVAKTTRLIDGVEQEVALIANVYPDSPAEKAGLLRGDAIVFVGKGEDRVSVNKVGYSAAMDLMSGEEGTECVLTVYREASDGSDPSKIEITAVRKNLVTQYVTYDTFAGDSTVGIIRISSFESPTVSQFTAAVDALQKQGCTSFVLDLRGNPGGLRTSVEDLLIMFLKEGDTVLSTKDNRNQTVVTKIEVNKEGVVTCGTSTMKKEDIGKYRDLKISVLVNENSASAAELFTANMRDHQLAKVVGVKTYGKGSVQNTLSLKPYGMEGALKLTVYYYYPPSGEGYDGVGISPHDGYVVELSEEAAKIPIVILPHDQDTQLQKAVEAARADTLN